MSILTDEIDDMQLEYDDEDIENSEAEQCKKHYTVEFPIAQDDRIVGYVCNRVEDNTLCYFTVADTEALVYGHGITDIDALNIWIVATGAKVGQKIGDLGNLRENAFMGNYDMALDMQIISINYVKKIKGCFEEFSDSKLSKMTPEEFKTELEKVINSAKMSGADIKKSAMDFARDCWSCIDGLMTYDKNKGFIFQTYYQAASGANWFLKPYATYDILKDLKFGDKINYRNLIKDREVGFGLTILPRSSRSIYRMIYSNDRVIGVEVESETFRNCLTKYDLYYLGKICNNNGIIGQFREVMDDEYIDGLRSRLTYGDAEGLGEWELLTSVNVIREEYGIDISFENSKMSKMSPKELFDSIENIKLKAAALNLKPEDEVNKYLKKCWKYCDGVLIYRSEIGIIFQSPFDEANPKYKKLREYTNFSILDEFKDYNRDMYNEMIGDTSEV